MGCVEQADCRAYDRIVALAGGDHPIDGDLDLAGQLRLFKEDAGDGTQHAHIMQRIAERTADDALDRWPPPTQPPGVAAPPSEAAEAEFFTRHTALPTSSATSSPPLRSTSTPTGRP